jgi:hypothetical protein
VTDDDISAMTTAAVLDPVGPDALASIVSGLDTGPPAANAA